MARAGSISMRRLIFIVSSMFLVEGSVAAAGWLVERSPKATHDAALRMWLCRMRDG